MFELYGETGWHSSAGIRGGFPCWRCLWGQNLSRTSHQNGPLEVRLDVKTEGETVSLAGKHWSSMKFGVYFEIKLSKLG